MIDTKSKVLVVDDSDLVRSMLKRVLSELGFKEVHEAINGQTGLAKINEALEQNKPFDLIFLDWNMPVMTGYEMLQQCREKPELAHVPIVMVTAEAEKSQVIKALCAGSTEYIVKPCSADTLKEKIKNINTMNATTTTKAG